MGRQVNVVVAEEKEKPTNRTWEQSLPALLTSFAEAGPPIINIGGPPPQPHGSKFGLPLPKPLPQPVKLNHEQLKKKLSEWLQNELLALPQEYKTKKTKPAGPGKTFLAVVAAGGQPIIKGITGFFKADLIYHCMLFNLILASCRAVSALATGGTGTYDDMVHPEEKEEKLIKNTYERMKNHIEAQISIPVLTEATLDQFSSAPRITSENEARTATSLESNQPLLAPAPSSPPSSLDNQPSTPRKPPRVDSTPSMGDQSTSVGSPGRQSPSLTTEASSNDLNHLSPDPDTPTIGEMPPLSGTDKFEKEQSDRIKKQLEQVLTDILKLNMGAEGWNPESLFPKDQPKKWFSNVTEYLLDNRKDVVFGEWEKFISHFITPFALIGGSVFSCLSTYGAYMVFIHALGFPFFLAVTLSALTLVLSMVVAMTFYRNQISTAFLKFGKNLDQGGFYGLFVKENICPTLVALTSAITMPPLLFMSIHTPLMALALKIGITASILNPIAAIFCAILVAITTIAAIGANHSQASKLWENMNDLWKRLGEQQSFGGKALFCFAFAVALVISAATLVISVFGDVGGFRSLTDAGLALSYAFGAVSLVANASFMIADTLYKTTLSIHENCTKAIDKLPTIPGPSWPRFFPSHQAKPQTEFSDAKTSLLTPACAT